MNLAGALLVFLLATPIVLANNNNIIQSTDKSFYIEKFYYEDFVYSQGKKTELGDQVELDVAFRYQYSSSTFARIRFETIPEDNRFNNKTSKFELLAGHQYENLNFQLDLELDVNNSSSGGQTLGLDLDSEYTRLQWQLNNKVSLSFYPFNFDGEVGHKFNTWDVTRINYISGAPSTVSETQGTNSIVNKTIPGLELKYQFNDSWSANVGLGVASYLYPANGDFDIQNFPTATRWERKEDFGHKLGVQYKKENLKLSVDYVGHSEPKETGALLENAWSVYGIGRTSQVLIEGEFTFTKNGKEAWDIARGSDWFNNTTTPFMPIYADYDGNRQNWLGQSDYAISTKIGYEWSKSTTPYVTLRYQGKNFIFRDEESAHRLRTADESQSHGGLIRTGLGTYLKYGNFTVNPELEYRNAKNPVFTNAADEVSSQRLLGNFKKTDYLITLFLTYDFDGRMIFAP